MFIMQAVHLPSLDLNLLIVLEALVDTGSVTTAADRIGLTQSATSHALARLRATLGDPLFVRSRKGLVPTDRTLALAGPLRDALDRLRQVVAPPATFNPGAAKCRFVLCTADYTELVLFPRLVARLARSAPGIDLWCTTADDDPLERLARGEVDAFIGPVLSQYTRADIRERRLFDERFVSLVRDGHPAATRKWTLEQFAALDHALIAPQGRPGSMVDTLLEQYRLSRRIAVVLPHFVVAPFIIAATDLVLTIPERVARTFAEFLPLRIVDPPADVPGFTMTLMWHERRHHDPSHEWLRGELAAVAQSIDVTADDRTKHEQNRVTPSASHRPIRIKSGSRRRAKR